MGLMVKISFVDKVADSHLRFMPFSAKRDRHLLKYKMYDPHNSISYSKAFKTDAHWQISG